MFKKLIDGKKVIVKANSKNIPPFKVIKDIYATIPDNKRIPIVFETREQYLDEYIKNQEKAKKVRFTPAQKAAYKQTELAHMSNIVSRYTTDHNPFIDRRVVFFNDHKIPVAQFKDSAIHEYGHEVWEKNPKIRRDWKAVSKTSSPTTYGTTSKQEDFAESYMLHHTGRLQDQRRDTIISKDDHSVQNLGDGMKAAIYFKEQIKKRGKAICTECGNVMNVPKGYADKCYDCDKSIDGHEAGLDRRIIPQSTIFNSSTNNLFNTTRALFQFKPILRTDTITRDKQLYLGKGSNVAYTGKYRPDKLYLGKAHRFQDTDAGVEAVSTIIGQHELIGAMPRHAQKHGEKILIPLQPIPKAFGTTYATPKEELGLVGIHDRTEAYKDAQRGPGYKAYKNVPTSYKFYKQFNTGEDPFKDYPE